MIRSAFAAGFAFAIGIGSIPSAHAGLLDFLFGWRDRTDIANPAHPDVQITPKRAPVRKIVKARPKPTLTPEQQLANTIDPVKNPRWYLEDRTLRKGDILVLNDRVLVFKGGAVGEPKSYVALKQSRLLTATERARVAAMTAPDKPGAAAIAEAAPSKPRRVRSADIRRPDDRG